VEHHLKPSQFYKGKSRDKAIRKLATKVNISQLIIVAKADFLGRSDLISLGFSPSAQFKEILAKVYKLQLDGILEDKNSALKWVRKEYKKEIK